MYIEVSDKELERFEEVSDITTTEYEFKGNFVPVVSLVAMVEDLLMTIHERDDMIVEMEEDLHDNYRKIPVSEQYGIEDRDFIWKKKAYIQELKKIY